MPLSIPTPSIPFPLYLRRPNPFRRSRRRSSTTTASSSSSTPSSPSTSPPTQPTSFLSTPQASHLRCHKCLADLIPVTSIISKGFTGRHGRAYLVAAPPASAALGTLPASDLPNTYTHKPVPRQLVTGAHTVSDISCRGCGSVLGWKYVDAEEETQRYKVGKFILETGRVVRGVGWDFEGEEDAEVHGGGFQERGEEEVIFNEMDEDECEDLFSGVWDAEVVGKRRKEKTKAFGRT